MLLTSYPDPASRPPAACGVRKLGSRGDAVFVKESAESVSALDYGGGRVPDSHLLGQGIGRLEILRDEYGYTGSFALARRAAPRDIPAPSIRRRSSGGRGKVAVEAWYLDVVPLPGGSYRTYDQARRPDESHELRTELIKP